MQGSSSAAFLAVLLVAPSAAEGLVAVERRCPLGYGRTRSPLVAATSRKHLAFDHIEDVLGDVPPEHQHLIAPAMRASGDGRLYSVSLRNAVPLAPNIAYQGFLARERRGCGFIMTCIKGVDAKTTRTAALIWKARGRWSSMTMMFVRCSGTCADAALENPGCWTLCDSGPGTGRTSLGRLPRRCWPCSAT